MYRGAICDLCMQGAAWGVGEKGAGGTELSVLSQLRLQATPCSFLPSLGTYIAKISPHLTFSSAVPVVTVLYTPMHCENHENRVLEGRSTTDSSMNKMKRLHAY